MKATLQMEAVKPPTDVVMMPHVDHEKNASISSRNIILFSVLGLATVLVTAAIVLTSLYFGAHLFQNDIKEYSDILPHGNTHIRENTETQLGNDKLTIVRDYKKKLAVYLFSGFDVCYVSTFNATTINESFAFPSPTVDQDTTVTYYKITDMELSADILSYKAQKLCDGKTLLWIKQMNKKERSSPLRHKRAPKECCADCERDCTTCCAENFTI